MKTCDSGSCPHQLDMKHATFSWTKKRGEIKPVRVLFERGVATSRAALLPDDIILRSIMTRRKNP